MSPEFSLCFEVAYIWLEVPVATSISRAARIQIKNISESNIHADQANPPQTDSCHFETHKTKCKSEHCQHAYRCVCVHGDQKAH